jgi:DNA-binding PadR family transcriptional regulator
MSNSEFERQLQAINNVRAERDTLRALLQELHDALRQSYSITPEGRKYLERMQRAIDDCES